MHRFLRSQSIIEGPSSTFSKPKGIKKHAGVSRHFGNGATVAVIALGLQVLSGKGETSDESND